MAESGNIEIGGAPVVTLERPLPADLNRPAFRSARILPGRGMIPALLTGALKTAGPF